MHVGDHNRARNRGDPGYSRWARGRIIGWGGGFGAAVHSLHGNRDDLGYGRWGRGRIIARVPY